MRCLLIVVFACVGFVTSGADAQDTARKKTRPAKTPQEKSGAKDALPEVKQASVAFTQRVVAGRVVYLAEAIARRFGVKSVAEAGKRTLALETKAGQLFPIVEDIRGRAFRRDDRLRKMQVELVVRQYKGTSVLQVIRVYEVDKKKKLIVDYWCEICSIPLFELKPCDCCQGPLELRKRVVKDYKPIKD